MGQDRDSPDPQQQALGARLRKLRGRRSLRAVAEQTLSSRSTLSRLERAEVFPDASLIERLDGFYGLNGELVAERQRLLEHPALPPRHSPWRRRWLHHYPADYAGETYLNLALPPEDRPARVHLRIRWGQWQLDLSLYIDDPEGVTCAFTKGDDGLSKPVIVTVDRRASVIFGVGAPPVPAIDINAGWILVG